MGSQSTKFLDKLDAQALKDALLLEAARDNGAITAALDSGADIETRDASGATPLHLAAAAGHVEAVRQLVIRGGADMNARDNAGRTAMHLAAENGRQGVLNALIEMGAETPATPQKTGTRVNGPRVQVIQPGQKQARIRLQLQHDPALIPALLHLNASDAIH